MNLSAYLRRIYKCCYLDGYVMRYAQIVYRTKLRPLVAIYIYVICSLDSKYCTYISSIIIKRTGLLLVVHLTISASRQTNIKMFIYQQHCSCMFSLYITNKTSFAKFHKSLLHVFVFVYHINCCYCQKIIQLTPLKFFLHLLFKKAILTYIIVIQYPLIINSNKN